MFGADRLGTLSHCRTDRLGHPARPVGQKGRLGHRTLIPVDLVQRHIPPVAQLVLAGAGLPQMLFGGAHDLLDRQIRAIDRQLTHLPQ
ncbi:Uncharacterised protein [Mycobacteroides abscessus subsp. abscessus]|nr:Uncharacterised protein [Mycobacteroides abscessus subsp. abscessus]